MVKEVIGKHTFLKGDTNEVMQELINEGCKVDYILTSPPYNAHRTDFYNGDTKINDSKTQEEYSNWLISHFKLYNDILKENGIIFYNINYMSSKNNNVSNLYKTILEIEENSEFIVIDDICWKKDRGIPCKEARLSRVWEHILIFIRKKDWVKFHQKYSKILTGKYNLIEAPNNDFTNDINKACFSSEMVKKVLELYKVEKDSIVLDNFMGTGTTAIGCEKYGCHSLGIELDDKTYEFCLERTKSYIGDFKSMKERSIFNFDDLDYVG